MRSSPPTPTRASGTISIPAAITLNSPDPQAIRPPEEKVNVLMVTLPTNFKVARFDNDKSTAILRQLEKDVEAARFDAPEGKIELPVKLKVYDSIFVPLAKWAMLLAGNYRCVTKDGMRTAQEAVHTDIETSRSVYNFVNDLCVKLGAAPGDLVPFEKYAAAAQSLVRPASAARALNNGVPNIERADKLVQLIAKQKGLSHPVIDAEWRWSTSGWRPTGRRRRDPSLPLPARGEGWGEGGGPIESATPHPFARLLLSGRGAFRRAARRCCTQRRKEQFGRHAETGAQALHHRHAQPLLATQDFTHAARSAQDRHQIRAREAVLIHEVADHLGDAWRPTRPFRLFIGGDQARLRLQSGDVGRIVRIPQPVNECPGARELRLAIDQDQGRIHHTVSASILPYSACVPKNRIARTPARYCKAAINR